MRRIALSLFFPSGDDDMVPPEESSEDFTGIGTYYRTAIDEKGRLLFSKQFRSQIGTTFVLNYGDVGQLEAYSLSEWKKLQEQVAAFDKLGTYGRMYQRARFGRHMLIKLDPQGRASIPQDFRDLAKIKKEVVFLSGIGCMELWDPVEWELAEDDISNYGLKRRESIQKAFEQSYGPNGGPKSTSSTSEQRP